MNKKLFEKEPIETIPCPLHGQPLEVKEQDGKIIGICRCDAPNNLSAGQPVYERAADNKE